MFKSRNRILLSGIVFILLTGGLVLSFSQFSNVERDTSCQRTEQALKTYGLPPQEILENQEFKDEIERCKIKLPTS